ncbi:MAG: bifunctional phosphopantothenoylcysteine decarboxylase/phosphopantothenate--cysteine ligase CoaBC [Thermoanaerobaculia bacterium]|nr:bifunctional phosphopantothenoylcysteine decarboxylase/phosphopantothenate--cysteine ligase CoaBC [Thermoanaerobaculia bacterium]
MPVLSGKRILLGVSGSIAAYKAADLASRLTKAGARVDAILTAAASRFVTPLTFQSLTGRPAPADLWSDEAHVLHVGLADGADLLVVAPATADILAKLAHGLADDLLTVTALAARCPLLVAPAMDAGMFDHPAVQANLATLRARGATVIGPAEGRMASGLEGRGRMLEPEEILGHVRLAAGRNGPLAGRRVVVTAGGTQEPIDPVRVLANRSSGKQGFAVAQAALDRGAAVTLVAANCSLTPPVGAARIDVATAQEMADAVLESCAGADALVMAAAVADFRPARPAARKLKKDAGLPSVELERTIDILGVVTAARARPACVVGFAAETGDLLANARKKLKEKRLSLIVANDVTQGGAGFGSDANRVTLIDATGAEELPLLSKAEVAGRILDRVQALLPPA